MPVSVIVIGSQTAQVGPSVGAFVTGRYCLVLLSVAILILTRFSFFLFVFFMSNKGLGEETGGLRLLLFLRVYLLTIFHSGRYHYPVSEFTNNSWPFYYPNIKNTSGGYQLTNIV